MSSLKITGRILSVALLFLSLSAPSVRATPANVRDEALFALTKTVLTSKATDHDARRRFERAFHGRPRDFATVLAAVAEVDSGFRPADPRAYVCEWVHEAFVHRPADDATEWATVAADLTNSLGRMLTEWNPGNRHLKIAAEMKLALDLFTVDDLTFLSRKYLRTYSEAMAEPWLRLTVGANDVERDRILDRINGTDVAVPLLGLARAYQLGWARSELDVKRILRAIPGDVTGIELWSARGAHRRLAAANPSAAERFRILAADVLTDVLTDLHRRYVEGDSAVTTALTQVRFLPRARRTDEYKLTIERLNAAVRFGEGLDDLTDVATRCEWHLR